MNNNFIQTAKGLTGAIPELALILSSSFFISLFLILVFAGQYIFNLYVLFYSSIAILLIYAYLVRKIKSFSAIFLAAGSLAFFIFFLSQFAFNKSNPLVQAYSRYAKAIELALNYGLIDLVLNLILFFVVFAILLKILSVCLEIIGHINYPSLRRALYSIILIIVFVALFFLRYGYFKNLNLTGLAKYFIPILGFSLVYLHGNFLIKSLNKKYYG